MVPAVWPGLEGYMAYARRSPVVIGCRPEALREALSMRDAARRILDSDAVTLCGSRARLLRGLGAGFKKLVIHASEKELWRFSPGQAIAYYHVRVSDIGREACRRGAEAVLIHHVHPLSGERRDLKPIIEDIEECSRPVALVVDASFSAGLLPLSKPLGNYVFFYRLDKWLMGPPLIAVHSDKGIKNCGKPGFLDEVCAASSIKEALDKMLRGSDRERLFGMLDELSWEIDKLGLRTPTPPERGRRAALISLHAGRASARIAGLLASRGIIIDVEQSYLRISPHSNVGEGEMNALLRGLAEAKDLMA